MTQGAPTKPTSSRFHSTATWRPSLQCGISGDTLKPCPRPLLGRASPREVVFPHRRHPVVSLPNYKNWCLLKADPCTAVKDDVQAGQARGPWSAEAVEEMHFSLPRLPFRLVWSEHCPLSTIQPVSSGSEASAWSQHGSHSRGFSRTHSASLRACFAAGTASRGFLSWRMCPFFLTATQRYRKGVLWYGVISLSMNICFASIFW